MSLSFRFDQEIELTKEEEELINLLLSKKDVAFSREYIQQVIFHNKQSSVDPFVKALNSKLIHSELCFRIQVIWGYGYKITRII